MLDDRFQRTVASGADPTAADMAGDPLDVRRGWCLTFSNGGVLLMRPSLRPAPTFQADRLRGSFGLPAASNINWLEIGGTLGCFDAHRDITLPCGLPDGFVAEYDVIR